ncbi:hypothetical protein [Bradyrhizobium diazoefficiens]|uniref:hypothetical protein n=1 Tax=Bradyrhizobium diazoefficiens TaxID=1355477 RepID=UPI0004B1D966|nr:hypothetical protein [Bradyrhizobium diazoefficiens]
MSSLTRRLILAGAASAAAVAAVPSAAIVDAFPSPPYVDRQRFFDGRVDWTFYARRRKWVGIDREHA